MALLLGRAAAASCQTTSAAGGAGAAPTTGSSSGTGMGTGGSTALSNFTPTGCGFSIAPRMEYTDWGLSQPMTAATPHIRRVRLGLGGNVQGTTGRADPSTSIGVAWQTDEGTLASQIAWGSDPDPTTWPAANRLPGITWDTPPGTINADGSERMHEVYVCGLTPATTYYYRVGGGPTGTEQWSPVFTFTTTPAPGPTAVTFGITGDSRGEQNNAWQILQRRMHVLSPTMMLFSGDVINLATDQGEWEEWLDKAELDSDGKTYLTLPQTLTMAAHGNHDNHTALFFGNLAMPQDNVKYPQYGELFYSMDVGPVHVIVTDDSWIADPSGDSAYAGILQTWLDADLTAANANRSKVPWIITVNHRPDYSSSLHGMDADVLLSRAFYAPIWQKYHVDMAFAGHDHDYERTNPLNIGSDVNSPTSTTADQGTVFVVCAGSGADGYSAGMSSFTAVSKDFVAGGGPIGLYGILTVDDHNLKLEAHQLEADASDPIFDTYTITK